MRWIVGDIHGMLRPLETLIHEASRIDREAMFYFTGDYVNRGPQSREVIELLLGMSNVRCIRGNHDDILDQILHGISFSGNGSQGDRFAAFEWFLNHGLFETLRSYGCSHDQVARVVEERSKAALQPIIDAIPAEHRGFIRALPAFIDDEDLFVVHGKWPVAETASPRALLGESIPPPALRHEILWGRFTEAEIGKAKQWPKTGLFGHTPVQSYPGHAADPTPIMGTKMVLLDTAAALSPTGRLSAVCAESGELVQADPAGKLLPQSEDAAAGG